MYQIKSKFLITANLTLHFIVINEKAINKEKKHVILILFIYAWFFIWVLTLLDFYSNK